MKYLTHSIMAILLLFFTLSCDTHKVVLNYLALLCGNIHCFLLIGHINYPICCRNKKKITSLINLGKAGFFLGGGGGGGGGWKFLFFFPNKGLVLPCIFIKKNVSYGQHSGKTQLLWLVTNGSVLLGRFATASAILLGSL